MFSTPPVFNTGTSNASNSNIRSMCLSADLSLDIHDEYMLNILKELQCPGDQRIVEECDDDMRVDHSDVTVSARKWP